MIAASRRQLLFAWQWRRYSLSAEQLCELPVSSLKDGSYLDKFAKDEFTNVPTSILSKIGKGLHLQASHPLGISRRWMCEFFEQSRGLHKPFIAFNNLHQAVTVEDNFDSLRIPKDHPSRSVHDTYYINGGHVLRTHTSAHECSLLSVHPSILVTGDVFRRDEIDATHYPVFHQMEGASIVNISDVIQKYPHCTAQEGMEKELKDILEGLVKSLFAHRRDLTMHIPMRWVNAYFPFTHPSWELEIFYQDKWLEVLGCGIHHPEVLSNAHRLPEKEIGWAFGIGLERIAMTLFSIPDIRLFWSQDDRFLQQFKHSQSDAPIFTPFSKYPSCNKDVSVWLPDSTSIHDNDVFEVIRNIAGDLAEQVQVVDQFKQDGKESRCYRITYRSMERNVTNTEINQLQDCVRESLVKSLNVTLR